MEALVDDPQALLDLVQADQVAGQAVAFLAGRGRFRTTDLHETVAEALGKTTESYTLTVNPIQENPIFSGAIATNANEEGGLAESVHPFGEIVKILTVPIPLQPFVERFICTPLFKRFADPQAAGRWMTASSLLVESTNPATSDIVIAIPPKHSVYLVD